MAKSHYIKNGDTKSCGCISRSTGEKLVEKLLNENNIEYKKEHSFENFVYEDTKYPPRYDFYLPKYNCCIEIDGEQHFKPVCFGGISLEEAEKNFKIQQKRDNIKNNYCNSNNIKLVRIPYYDYLKINYQYLMNLILGKD